MKKFFVATALAATAMSTLAQTLPKTIQPQADTKPAAESEPGPHYLYAIRWDVNDRKEMVKAATFDVREYTSGARCNSALKTLVPFYAAPRSQYTMICIPK